ncbi:MAG: M48 family metallopeptidase [Methylophilaceae bacterium]
MKNITSLLIAFTLALGGCTSVQTTKSGTVGVERKQYMLLSEQQVENMSAQSYIQTLKQADSNKALNTDSAETARVRNIAQRLIAQTGTFRPDALNWKWAINVQESKEINAYCMAGGKIMVYSGLLDQIKPTDDELAAVMGHEMAHALREHSREQMSEAYAQQIGLLGLAAVVGITSKDSNKAGTALALGSTVAAVALTLPHSRRAEHEADQIGLELAARAGYNPNAALTLWEKMAKAGGAKPPEFLSTHPSDASRMDDIKRLIPAVMPLYEQAKNKKP